MTTERRFVFDTNVLIRALLIQQSVARQAFDLALKQGQLLMSLATLEELHQVLQREKFKKYITETEREEFIRALVREVVFVNVTTNLTVCRDPKDDKFLELAIEGNAACIISDDEDLLALHPFRGIPILTPQQFLESVSG